MRGRSYAMQNKGITLTLKIAFVQPTGREGEFSWEFLVEVLSSVLHILMSTSFQTKKCHCPQPFSDLTSKIHTHFRQNATFKYSLAEIRSLLLRFERQIFFSWRIRILPFGILFASFCFLQTFGHQNAQRHYALMHNNFQCSLHILLVRDFRKSPHLNAIWHRTKSMLFSLKNNNNNNKINKWH